MKIEAEISDLRKHRPSEEDMKFWLRSWAHSHDDRPSSEDETGTDAHPMARTMDYIERLKSIKREGDMIVRKHKDADGREYVGKKDITLENIDALASDIGCLPGKWLVFLDSTKVDMMWFKVGEAVIRGELGLCAKVSTRKQAKIKKKDVYVICIYTDNYLDEADVMKVRDKLRELGINWGIYYKPDIYTYLGIYSGTTKLRASRYYSR